MVTLVGFRAAATRPRHCICSALKGTVYAPPAARPIAVGGDLPGRLLVDGCSISCRSRSIRREYAASRTSVVQKWRRRRARRLHRLQEMAAKQAASPISARRCACRSRRRTASRRGGRRRHRACATSPSAEKCLPPAGGHAGAPEMRDAVDPRSRTGAHIARAPQGRAGRPAALAAFHQRSSVAVSCRGRSRAKESRLCYVIHAFILYATSACSGSAPHRRRCAQTIRSRRRRDARRSRSLACWAHERRPADG